MKKRVSIFFLMVISVMFVLVFVSGGKDVLRKSLIWLESWNGIEQYPLLHEQENIQVSNYSLSDKAKRMMEMVEDEASSDFEFAMPFVLMKRGIDKALGLDMTASLTGGRNDLASRDDVVLSCSDDYLVWICDDVDITDDINSLIQFGKSMQAEGRNFLFFEAPDKFEGNQIYRDYSNEKYELISQRAEDNGIQMIDVNDELRKSGLTISDIFFKTDHHWTPKAGLWGCQLLCEKLNEQFGYSFDALAFDFDNYQAKCIDEKYLGSLGKKVTKVYTKSEEFILYEPTVKSDLTVFSSLKNCKLNGEIQEVLFDYGFLNDTKKYKKDVYWVCGQDQPLVSIHNNKIKDGSHILLIKSSMGNVMYPYLALVVEQLDVIDLRYFKGSLQSYIKVTNPDTIVVIYGLGSFGNGAGSDLFDFR